MTSLPVIQPTRPGPPEPAPRNRRWAAVAVHVGRWLVVGAIVGLVGWKHQVRQAQRPMANSLQQLDAAALSTLKMEGQNITGIGSWTQATRPLLDSNGQQLGIALTTSPESDGIIGYQGPTEVLVVLDSRGKICDLQIMESADTEQHVDAIREDRRFFQQWSGQDWGQPDRWPEMDAVSGATLTSYAIMASIRSRAGGAVTPLKFPEPITAAEVAEALEVPDVQLRSIDPAGVLSYVVPSSGESGYVLRTAPAADRLSGFQGPTDCLLILDTDRKLTHLRIRDSFDNQPYVRYVEQDDYLQRQLSGLAIDAIPDYPAEEYEGVSGATMTSLNVLAGIQQRASELQDWGSRSPESVPSVDRLSAFRSWLKRYGGDTLTIGLVLLAAGWTWWPTSRWKRLRIGFLVLVIGYLGFVRGDLLSQSLLVGWSKWGLPWQMAPGLVAVAAAALGSVALTRQNLYCHQLCPFGAVQQVMHRTWRPRFRVGTRWRRVLRLIPVGLLLVTVLVATGWWDVNLAGIEPFDAFSFRIAGGATLAVAIVGLLAASAVPMAYCQYGCPTGTLLDYLKFNRRSDRWRWSDACAVAVLIWVAVAG